MLSKVVQFFHQLCQKTEDSLPAWKTLVVKAEVSQIGVEQIRIFIAASSHDEVKLWLKEFQAKTKTTYNVRTTYNHYKGTKVKFKQVLHCQHNMRTRPQSNPAKNTNCQSKMTITLHSDAVVASGRSYPNPRYPCEVIVKMSHNHGVNLVDKNMKTGSVSKEAKQKLLDLFKRGHSPATALEMLKTDIYLNCDNYEEVLPEKYHCPDYRLCSQVYNKEFKSKHGTVDFNKNGKEFLVNKIREFNRTQETNSVEIFFSDEDYAICICQPLLRRVHMYAPSEAIFINSFSGVSFNGIGIFVLSTYIDCLPLGIIITSGDDANLFCTGLQLLHNLLGSDIFGGDTPTICVVDDFTLEMTAIDQVWPKAKCYSSTFHVLQSTWRWITSSKHNIPHDLHNEFYEAFKKMLHSETEAECNAAYKEAFAKARRHSSYRKYLEHYWEKRKLWVSYFRDDLLAQKDYSYCSEVVTKLIKDKFFQRAKAFNVEQLLDYILTMFVRYYEIHLLEVAKVHLGIGKLIGMGKLIEMPPLHLIEKIAQHENHIVVVPSGEQEKLLYIVNTEVLICSCNRSSKGLVCRHTEWACAVTHAEAYNLKMNTPKARTLFYKVATGHDPPQDFLVPKNLVDADCTSVTLSPIGEVHCDLDEDYRISEEHCDLDEDFRILENCDLDEDYKISEHCGLDEDHEIAEELCDPAEDYKISEQVSDLDEDYKISQEYIIEQISSEAAVLEGQDIIKQMNLQMSTFLTASPQDVLPALKLLHQKIRECRTTSDFVSMCHNFERDDTEKRKSDEDAFFEPSHKRQNNGLLEIGGGESGFEESPDQQAFLEFDIQN